MGAGWTPPPAGARYQLTPNGPVSSTPTELATAVTPDEGGDASGKPWSPSSPLFWFGAIAAVTFGLMAVSTSVRVGSVKASVSAGK